MHLRPRIDIESRLCTEVGVRLVTWPRILNSVEFNGSPLDSCGGFSLKRSRDGVKEKYIEIILYLSPQGSTLEHGLK